MSIQATPTTGSLAAQADSEPPILQRLEQWLDRLAPGLALALIFVFGVWAWFASREFRFWMDELLGITAATAPTNREVVEFLASGIDFNPPLSHFLIRASMSLFGDAEWAARLPAFLGVVLTLACLYIFVSRRLTRIYGVLAILVLMCSPVRTYAREARPYGLVLGFCALALVLYQSYRQTTKRGTRVTALAGLSLCAACLAATHYYAILAIAVFVLAEAVRVWKSRTPDWTLLACCIVPPVIVLFFLRNVMREQRQQLTHYFARGNLLSFNDGYSFLALDPLIYGLVILFIACALLYHFSVRGRQPDIRPESNFPPHEIAAGIGLLLLPLLGAFFTQFVTHAYLARYFLPAAIGFSICLCYGVRFFSSFLPGLIVLLVVPLGLGFGKELMHEMKQPVPQLSEGASIAAANGPILFDTPGEYIVIYHYFRSLRDKIWVIADPAASLRYRNYDTDDKIMLSLASKGRAQAITLREAARRWSNFSLVPRPDDHVWALKCVMDAQAQIKVKYPFGDSNFIFDVTVPPEILPQIDACSAGK